MAVLIISHSIHFATVLNQVSSIQIFNFKRIRIILFQIKFCSTPAIIRENISGEKMKIFSSLSEYCKNSFEFPVKAALQNMIISSKLHRKSWSI